ncbi:hypothetical protein Tco_1017283 [Tanacetum coccineum]|uniref:DUF4219 domain-containing protein n=1 Tax=Tanacetum coccineum TaxID=301880 RepID=A0ABQ5FR17_9ASTR
MNNFGNSSALVLFWEQQSTDKESSAAGTDNRPPMLVESDYKSWKIRIERYIRSKPLGKLIWRSIQNGPTPHPQITVTEGQGDVAVQVTRDNQDEEFTKIENNKELADIQATNILRNESIHDYFVRFHKLVNDIKITQLDIPTHQMNTKFVNNLPPYWAKTSSNSRSHATVHDGKIITKTVQRRAQGNVGNMGNRGTKNYGQMTDNVGKKLPYDQPLDITTTNMFEKTPMVHPTSQVNKVHTDTNQIFDNVNHLLTHEMHQEEHLDSDVESNIDDNTIPLSSVTYLTAKFKCSNLGYRPAPTVHDSEDSLVQAEVSRTKMSERLGTIKPINYAELNALYSHFVPQKELSREQVYWLPAEELATQKRNTPRSIELEELKIYKEATNALMELKNVRVCENSNSTASNAMFEINKLKDQLQGKDDTIKNLHTQINIMRMLNVGSTIGSFDKQALETELS